MADFDLFTRLGLFVAPDFLPAEQCAHIRTAMARATSQQATVTREGATFVDESYRRTKRVHPPEEVISLVAQRLRDVRAQLETHFDVRLGEPEEPQFLLYREGEYFKAHRDSSSNPQDGLSTTRRVTTVLFVNSEAEQPDEERYSGGKLTFYGLGDEEDPLWRSFGFPLAGRAGLLVAFPSDAMHEVTPVVAGNRYTITSWFPGREDEAERA